MFYFIILNKSFETHRKKKKISKTKSVSFPHGRILKTNYGILFRKKIVLDILTITGLLKISYSVIKLLLAIIEN